MTESKELNSVGGTAPGAATQDELKAKVVVHPYDGSDIKALGENIVRAIDWSTTSSTDVSRSTKYPSDPNTVYQGAGAFSFTPSLGRFIFGSSANEPDVSTFKIDKYKDFIKSDAVQTIVGTTKIETKDGYFLNPKGSKYPSTHFTPQKTWVRDILSPLMEDNLMEIAFLEALQVLILTALKGTKSEQIVKENKIDLGTIILGSQEIEDHILEGSRS